LINTVLESIIYTSIYERQTTKLHYDLLLLPGKRTKYLQAAVYWSGLEQLNMIKK